MFMALTQRWMISELLNPLKTLQDEHPRPKYVKQLRNSTEVSWTENFITKEKEPVPPFWKMKLPGIVLSWTTIFMLIAIATIFFVAIIIYRMSMVLIVHNLGDSSSMFITVTAATINLVFILIFKSSTEIFHL